MGLLISESVVNYIINILLDNNCNNNLISYTKDLKNNAKIIIYPSKFFECNYYGTSASIPNLPLKQWNGIPFLYGDEKILKKGTQIILYADLIASAYFLMTRYEELINLQNRDEHGRFMGEGCLMNLAGCMERPLVDEYGLMIRSCLRELGESLNIEKTGLSKIYLTHDLDQPWMQGDLFNSVKVIGKEFLLNHHFCVFPIFDSVFKKSYIIGSGKGVKWIMNQDKKLKHKLGNKVQDIYFAIANEEQTLYTNSYIHEARFNYLLKMIFKEEASIGLHSSYEAGEKIELIKKEKTVLENIIQKKILFHRNHYLRSNRPSDFEILIYCGIMEDFTMGYADRVGFRLGTAKSIYWINPISLELTNLLLHPLAIMECSLSDYMLLDERQSFNKIKKIIECIMKVNGEFCFLLHNQSIMIGANRWWKKVYRKMIDYLINM